MAKRKTGAGLNEQKERGQTKTDWGVDGGLALASAFRPGAGHRGRKTDKKEKENRDGWERNRKENGNGEEDGEGGSEGRARGCRGALSGLFCPPRARLALSPLSHPIASSSLTHIKGRRSLTHESALRAFARHQKEKQKPKTKTKPKTSLAAFDFVLSSCVFTLWCRRASFVGRACRVLFGFRRSPTRCIQIPPLFTQIRKLNQRSCCYSCSSLPPAVAAAAPAVRANTPSKQSPGWKSVPGRLGGWNTRATPPSSSSPS